MFDLNAYWKPRKFGVEQKAFKYTLKPVLDEQMRLRNVFFLVEELKDLGTNKNVRIEGLVPRFEMKTIFFRRDHTDLIDEMITFPKGVWDDLLDALAYQLGLTSPADPKGHSQRTLPQARQYGRKHSQML